ncbi:MAG TPA: plastocyanin/azurin family copper-binding protein [Longimicrobium sp.]|jgi:plastocyanin
MKLFIRSCAAVLVAGLVACGGGGDGGGVTDPPNPPNPPPPTNNVVTIHLTSGLRFAPADVTIAPGTTVRWVNDVAMGHTITPDDAGQAGAWPSTGISEAGAVYEKVFTTTGDFAYHCNPHSGVMRGTIRVK